MRVRIVPELDDERMPIECGLHDAALHAASTAVHEANAHESCLRRRLDIFIDDRRDIARRERVQIQLTLDRKAMRHEISCHGRAYVAVTTVLMPPRTEKSPTTVMRRGCRTVTRSSRI